MINKDCKHISVVQCSPIFMRTRCFTRKKAKWHTNFQNNGAQFKYPVCNHFFNSYYLSLKYILSIELFFSHCMHCMLENNVKNKNPTTKKLLKLLILNLID